MFILDIIPLSPEATFNVQCLSTIWGNWIFSLGNLESGLEVRQENSGCHPLPVKWAKKQKNNFAENKVSLAEGGRLVRYTKKLGTERPESLAGFPVPGS